MTYTAAAILGLASQCAPNVAAQTVAAIVQTESQGNPLALNVNGPRQPRPQSTASGAAATARQYIAAGYSVDLGLGQINSRNMRRLGLTWETVFDPCANIAALGRVLTLNFQSVASGRHPQAALRLALSLYNTGSPSRGLRNGYVSKVVGNAGVVDTVAMIDSKPSSSTADAIDVRSITALENAGRPEQLASQATPPPAWNVFERADYARQTRGPKTDREGINLWAN